MNKLHQEHPYFMFLTFPFLKQFITSTENGFPNISSLKINEYVGEQFIKHHAEIKYSDVMELLAIAQERGDMDWGQNV